jgi:hypothetical protein
MGILRPYRYDGIISHSARKFNPYFYPVFFFAGFFANFSFSTKSGLQDGQQAHRIRFPSGQFGIRPRF